MAPTGGLLSTSTGRPRPRFHPLRVVGVERVADGAVAVTFGVPDGLAGEFLRFRPGQHLTLRAEIDGEPVRQSYSIAMSRSAARRSGTLRIAAAGVPGGRMSTWLTTRVRPGDVIDVLPPLGDFTAPTVPGAQRHHVAIVGGSGITPVLSLITTVLEDEPRSRVTLVYANRTAASTMFLEELEALSRTHEGRCEVVHVRSREPGEDSLRSGRIDRSRLVRLLDAYAPVEDVDEWYLCGPAGLVETAQDTLADAGVDASRVHHEVFWTPPTDEHDGLRSAPATATRERPAS